MIEWRAIPGWEEYEASNDGRVRNARTKYVLRPNKTSWGYLRVNLSRNNRSKDMRIHQAVCLAFHPKVAGKPHVNHKDCDKLNNNAENLEWISQRENSDHALANGRFHAITNPKAAHKLSVERAAEIRRRHDAGEPYYLIARDFPECSYWHVRNVARRVARVLG